MTRRFIRGLLWGAAIGAVLTMYLSGGDGRRSSSRWAVSRARRSDGEAGPDDLVRERPSAVQLALEAGRAAVEATRAALARRA